ncbi:MAG: hypothetical protein JRG86_13820 [Deltaproteobacteria bacterium]|jgi:hypothetical protein|nr:hypothetical protein [Deltaproteobacteria bacterium]MBW2496701.1 hypothetical protein [Deltaproteobacteria bacterium]
MNRFNRMALLVMAIVCCALLASASEWQRGRAYVDSVDPAARTITIDGEIYRVPATCRIHYESGAKARLSDIRAIDRSREVLIPTNEVDFVRFEALQAGTSWDMVELVVVESPPQ